MGARAGSNDGCEPPRSTHRRSGAIARRSAILLSGTAALALSIAQPAHAISLNDPQANTIPGGVANYFDSTNQYPNVVAILLPTGGGCTGTLIDPRTVLTAAHCFFESGPPPATGAWTGGPTPTNPNLPIPRVS